MNDLTRTLAEMDAAPSRRLTLATLAALGACSVQLDRFSARWGESVEVTETLCEEVANYFDFDWAAQHLLTAPAQAEYQRACAPARAEYERVTADAWAEYARVTAPAWAEYDRVTADAWAEYARVTAPAWAEYARVTADARAEYERVTADAWAGLYIAEAQS